MNCEFCGEPIPNGEYSCPSCGSLIRSIFSDKSNTVLSAEQQLNISEYKSEYNYTLTNDNDDDVIYDVSKQKFEPQKNTSNYYDSGRDVITGQNTAYAPSQKTYRMRSEDKILSQNQTSDNKKKISLKKGSKPKIDLRKNNLNNIQYNNANNKPFMNTHEEPRFENGYIKLPEGMTEKEFMGNHFLRSVRTPYYFSIVLMYVSVIRLVFLSAISFNVYSLFCVLLILALTLGIQLKNSYLCACILAVFSITYSLLMNFVYYMPIEVELILSGIIAVYSLKKFNMLWNEYIDTGRIPYKG